MTKISYSFVGLLIVAIMFVGVQPVQASTTNSAQIAQLQALLIQLQAQLEALLNSQNSSTGSQKGDVRVVTGDVEESDIDNAVELSGEVDFNRDDKARVWFEYGVNTSLAYSTPAITIDEDEDDEDFTIIADDIDGNRTYYYRAVAEDESGDISEGAILSFKVTGDWDNDDDEDEDEDDDIPSVTTDEADDVDENSAELAGEVDMNDVNNGLVFLVYGEDEDMIEDVEDENEYNDIENDSDDLQKITLDSNFDDEEDFDYTVTGLDEDTEYFFRICVEYEDEDDDEVLECGDVESFETDNN